MRDGKALEMCTTHELGQNFARAFDIYFQSEEGQAELCYTTSWGASTRLVGGLIMAHGDDKGLLVPPQLAPTQVVVIAVREEAHVNEACLKVAAHLRDAGVRVEVDRVGAASGVGSPTGKSRGFLCASKSGRATWPKVSSRWSVVTTERRRRTVLTR